MFSLYIRCSPFFGTLPAFPAERVLISNIAASWVFILQNKSHLSEGLCRRMTKPANKKIPDQPPELCGIFKIFPQTFQELHNISGLWCEMRLRCTYDFLLCSKRMYKENITCSPTCLYLHWNTFLKQISEKLQFHLPLHSFQHLPDLAMWEAAFAVHRILSALCAPNPILFLLSFAAASIKLYVNLCGVLSSHQLRCRGQDRKRLFEPRQWCFYIYPLKKSKYSPWKRWAFLSVVKSLWPLGSLSDFVCTSAQLISVDLLQVYVAVGERSVLMSVIRTDLRYSIHC